ncbi:hypothetical protein ACVNF4_00480 [Streptomyces sp. S6]
MDLCNHFRIRSVRVYMHTHVLDLQAQSGQLVPQSVLFGPAEPQGPHALCEDRLRHDTIHGGTSQARQQFAHGGSQAGRSRFPGGSILHATHPRSLQSEIKTGALTMSTDVRISIGMDFVYSDDWLTVRSDTMGRAAADQGARSVPEPREREQ